MACVAVVGVEAMPKRVKASEGKPGSQPRPRPCQRLKRDPFAAPPPAPVAAVLPVAPTDAGHDAARRIRRAMERGESQDEIVRLLYREFTRILQEGRVTMDAACEALELTQAELDDKRAENSVSWAEAGYPHWRRRDQFSRGDVRAVDPDGEVDVLDRGTDSETEA
jgi:hypothetical protein